MLFVNGFEEQAAKEFMDRQLKARNQRGIDAMGDDTWASTYEVCTLHNTHEANTQQLSTAAQKCRMWIWCAISAGDFGCRFVVAILSHCSTVHST